MAPFDSHALAGQRVSRRPGLVDRLLRLQDRGRGFECHPEKNLLAIADATLRATTAVGHGAHPPITGLKQIIVLAAAQTRASKAAADTL